MTDEKGITRRDLFAYGTAAAGGAALIGSLSPREALGADAVPQVPRRTLGKTKQTIPILLMGGAMRFDQRFDPKLAECMRFGVNYFDVADCYAGGSSETAVGNFVEKTKVRDKLWITTKSDEWDPKGLEETLAVSLQKMKTGHVEMLYLHGLNEEDKLNAELAKKVDAL